MKLVSAALLVLFPAILTIAACPKNGGKQMLNLTENDSGKTLSIAKGQAFTLALPSHSGGGYRFDKAQYDSTILRLQKYTENPPPAGSNLGKPGKGVWLLTALKKGQTQLKITESRPWTKEGVIIGFENTVIVK